MSININSRSKTTTRIGKDKLIVKPLGAGLEVGRSAVYVEFKGKKILFDCGIHPGKQGKESLPYFGHIKPEDVDLCLVTHFHLDHCGSLPYFVANTGFGGKVYMTRPTKEIYKLNMRDSCRMSNNDVKPLYTKDDVEKSLQRIELINYREEQTYKGIKFYCLNAGHVLGAAMFMVEIAGVRILYTGDFSRDPDRHLMGAEEPKEKPDVIIVEATYGNKNHSKRVEREKEFIGMVEEVVNRDGRCLIPVFALGRAQELLLILEEHWENNRKRLAHIPIYYASSMAEKARNVFKKYITMMNQKLQREFDRHHTNPFDFKNIRYLKSSDDIQNGPCVVMASPGMLQSGMSLELFEKWCANDKNGVVFPGYSVNGTLAKTLIVDRPTEVPLSTGARSKVRMSINEISFSAHSDCRQTTDFIKNMLPCKDIVLVHGSDSNVHDLKAHLIHHFNDQINVHTPGNTKDVVIEFESQIRARIMGKLAADATPSDGNPIAGVLVEKDFKQWLVSPDDLPRYFDVNLVKVRQKLFIPLPNTSAMQSQFKSNADFWFNKLSKRFSIQRVDGSTAPVSVSKSTLDVMNDDDDSSSSRVVFSIGDSLQFIFDTGNPEEAVLEWDTSITNDLLVNALIISILDETPDQRSEHAKAIADNKMKDEREPLLDRVQETQMLSLVQKILKQHFELEDGSPYHMDIREKQLCFTLQGFDVQIDCFGNVTCKNDALHSRLSIMLKRIFLCLCPLPNQFGCLDEH